MIKIYHNPRCSKSREGCEILQNIDTEYEVIDYMKHPLSVDELIDLIGKLKIEPIDLVRKNEKIWKENFKDKELTPLQIIEAMHEFPQLIERPIVVNGNQAIIGRPPVLIKDLL